MKPSTKFSNPRAVAAKILTEVIAEKRSLNQAISRGLEKYPDTQANLVKELCFGSLRWYFRLSAIIKHLLKTPLKAKDVDIYALLMIGLYQLNYLNVPPHAAVNETVNAAKDLKKPWATRVLNASLRNFLRHRDQILREIDQRPAAYFSHPQWLIDQIKKAWPEHWQSILLANNERPMLCLRINRLKTTRQGYINHLLHHQIEIEPHYYAEDDITLKNPLDVTDIPGFTQGLVSVQDSGAQLAAILLDPQPGDRVLDACAAPGGKTTHLLEIQPQLKELLALEVDNGRLGLIEDNLNRLHLHAKLMAIDANKTQEWWDGELFDRILIDAPCSALGVIRRHPDIKTLRQENDIETLRQQQTNLLESLWPLLKLGGLLLYSTCSILPAENEQVIAAFLSTHADAKEKKINAAWGVEKQYGRQLLPSPHAHDGFYYCLISRDL